MEVLGIFFVEVIMLFFLSQSLTRALSSWFYYLFKNHAIVIHLMSILFLPGVILHELSHLLTASIFFVPTGEIEFLPEIRGNEVKMGSVTIASTDPLRRFIIGVAPLFGGLSILFLLFWFFLPTLTPFSWQTAVLLYAVFEISNTMFSSRKDMEGAIGLLIVGAVFVAILLFLRVDLWGILNTWIENIFVYSLFVAMSWCLGIALGLDIVILLLTKGILRLHKLG
ncbi:MAG TPA: hypothetical protein VF189_04690 [Patescibacteria group bacterium]